VLEPEHSLLNTQRFADRLLRFCELVLADQGASQVVQRAGHRRVVLTCKCSLHRQHLPVNRHGLRQLALVLECCGQNRKGIGHVLMVLAQKFLLYSQCLLNEGFRLGVIIWASPVDQNTRERVKRCRDQLVGLAESQLPQAGGTYYPQSPAVRPELQAGSSAPC